MPQTNTPIKFTEADKELIVEIRERLGCVSLADTIRQSLRLTAGMLHAETITIAVRPRKKNPRKSREGS